MRAHSLGVGDSFDEVAEELAPVALAALVGVLALALQDGDELLTGLEEPTPWTPMDCCANTCQRAPICQSTAKKRWPRLLEASMTVLA
jgi:hypothetical protein